jgi:hypothetical protein
MAHSPLLNDLHARRRRRDPEREIGPEVIRACDLARQSYRDYADSNGISYGEARRRLRAAVREGRTVRRDPEEVDR